MKVSFKSMGPILLITFIAAAFLLGGCGGGGGGSDDFSSGSSSGSGNVALLVADGPADDYDEIWICVTKVLLIPSDRNPNRSPVAIFESDACHEINLLELRDEDFLLTVKKRVPAGLYSKIRLEVKNIWAEGGPCDNFKLPSNRIDLNPRGDFAVRAGKTLAIRLDIDANKSINLHEAGNSGKCIFRPVVFVDIDTIETPRRCPRILKGTIISLMENEDTGVVEGFVLDLADKRGRLDVLLSDDPDRPTIIFGEDGNRVRPNALEPGQNVKVRGKITSKGDLTASVVIIGNVLTAKGTVVSSVNSNSIFPLLLDPGQALVGDQVDVEVTDATFVLLGCDEEVSTDAIQRGKRARVVGKGDLGEGVLRAVAVFLESEEIFGDLLDIEEVAVGNNLTIKEEDGNERTVFLPPDTPIFLQGNGDISLELLDQLLTNCGPKKVRVVLDPEETEPTAEEVRVQQERLLGQVDAILGDRVVRLQSGKLVRIQEGATILLNTKRADVPVDFDEIKVGDKLTLYGLAACSDLDVDFFAFIALVNESATDCDDDCNGDDDDDDDGDDDDDDDGIDSVFNPPSDHTDSQDGFLHKPGKENPFSNGCTACHGSDLMGGFAPSCFTCHGQEWDEEMADVPGDDVNNGDKKDKKDKN